MNLRIVLQHLSGQHQILGVMATDAVTNLPKTLELNTMTCALEHVGERHVTYRELPRPEATAEGPVPNLSPAQVTS